MNTFQELMRDELVRRNYAANTIRTDSGDSTVRRAYRQLSAVLYGWSVLLVHRHHPSHW